jgi:hypothetical protein
MTRFQQILATSAVLAISNLVSGCGSAKDYSGNLGSCTFTTSGLTTCMQTSFAGTLKSDPTTDAQASAKSGCADPAVNGTFTAGGTCATTGSSGSCTLTSSGTEGSETYTITTLAIYTTGFTTTTAQAACTASKGTYKAP